MVPKGAKQILSLAQTLTIRITFWKSVSSCNDSPTTLKNLDLKLYGCNLVFQLIRTNIIFKSIPYLLGYGKDVSILLNQDLNIKKGFPLT